MTVTSAMQGGLSRLLNSNDAPSPIEAVSVQQEVASLASQLAALEARLQKHRAILSPIRRLPVEILGQIFFFAVFSDAEYADEKERKALEAICRVCKAWNEAALITPQLWGRLDIDVYCADAHHDDVLKWLGRANEASRALNIASYGCDCTSSRVSYSNFEQEDVDERLGCLFQAEGIAKLLAVGPPLSCLHLEMESSLCFAHLTKSMNMYGDGKKSSWSSIRRLRLSWPYNGPWVEADSLSSSFFRHLPPNLEVLHLELPALHTVIRHRVLTCPWPLLHILPSTLQGLTGLSISTSWSGPHILDCLQHCKSLETLTVRYADRPSRSGWQEDTSTPLINAFATGPGVLLPKLQKLELCGLDSTAIGYSLSYLNAPFLSEIEVEFRNIDEHGDLTEGMPLALDDLESLEARTPNVRSQICSIVVSRDKEIEEVEMRDLMDVLSSLTSLTSLTLDHFTFDPLPLQSGANPTSFLPHLQYLALLNIPAEFNLEAILDYLVQRQSAAERRSKRSASKSGGGLKRVKIGYAEAIKPDSEMGLGDKLPLSSDITRRNMAFNLIAAYGVTIEGDLSLEDRWGLYHMSSSGRIGPYYQGESTEYSDAVGMESG